MSALRTNTTGRASQAGGPLVSSAVKKMTYAQRRMLKRCPSMDNRSARKNNRQLKNIGLQRIAIYDRLPS